VCCGCKKPFYFEESYYIDVRFYFKEDKKLKLETTLNSNSKDKIQVKKDEALIKLTQNFMSNPQVQLSKKDVQKMKEELVLPLLNIAELSLSDSYFLESMMDKTSRATMKQSKGWFDPHVRKLF
jgi:hypothetical protein